MNKSIRKFLTINALSLFGLSISLAIIANLYLKHQNVKVHLDAELSLEARMIASFLVERIDHNHLPHIQSKINSIPFESSSVAQGSNQYYKVLKKLVNGTQFQVWDLRDNTLLLSSSSAPPIALSNKSGFGYSYYNDHEWRTYSITLQGLNYKVISMQRHDLRLGFERQFIAESMITLILLFIFLVFAFQIIIRRSLSTLIETTSELKERKPNNLNAIGTETLPLEVQPLIIEINRLMRQLKDALEREQKFAADAAHELKTPLAAMKAQIQLAMRQPPEEQKQTFLTVEESIHRYDHIIKQLLSLSRTLSHSSLENFHLIDLDALAQSIIASLVPMALKRQINVELQQKDTPKIFASTTLLSVAMSNLISNAIQYTSDGDTIVVHITHNNKMVQVNVIDHGEGIPNHLKNDAIKRFSRLYNNQTTGSGLGLSIVSEICAFMRGNLKLNDTPNGGLTASMTLPINFSKKNETKD